MPALAALIFDVDGTLAETEEMHRAAFNAAFAEAGLGWDWDQALYAELLAVTGGKERIRYYQMRAGLAAPLDVTQVAVLHARKTTYYTTRMRAGGISLRPGVRRLLLEAKAAGLALAIATTTSRTNVEALLAAASPLPAFDVIAAGDEVAAKKPAPDVYVRALRDLGVPGAACLAFEDTENGLTSAFSAGVPCVVTVSAYGGAGPFPAAAAVVTSLGEVDAPATTLAGPLLRDGMANLEWLMSLRDTASQACPSLARHIGDAAAATPG